MKSFITRALLVIPLGLFAAAPLSAEPNRPVVDKKIQTGIEWLVEPKGVVIMLDGKKIGVAGEITFTETKPGKHEVKLIKGEDETAADVEVKKGQVLKFQFAFDT